MSQPAVDLPRSPFYSEPDDDWFYASAIHEEALARLLYAVEERRRLAVCTGPAGTGKTLLLQVLNRHCSRQRCDMAYCDATGLDDRGLLWQLAAELRLSPTVRASGFELWRRLEDHLRGQSFGRQQTVLLVDHIDRAQPSVVNAIWRLLAQPASPFNALTCILAARDVSRQQNGEALIERADVHARLQALDRRHTLDYVRHSMQQAGCREDWFENAAIHRLFEKSQGVLRTINRVCDLAFLAASETPSAAIDEELVEAAFEELRRA